MNLTPAIAAFLSGGMQGYQAGTANNQVQAKAELERAKAAKDTAKSDAEMLDKGLRFNDKTSKYEPYSEFYTPENPISPEQNSALDQAQTAAQAASPMAPPSASPYSPISTARANAKFNLMPQGDPNSLRLQRLAELKRSEHVAAIPKPGSSLATPDMKAEFSRVTGGRVDPEGLTEGQYSDTMKFIAGQTAASGRTSETTKAAGDRANTVIGSHEKTTQAQIDAANERARLDRESREKIAAQNATKKSTPLDTKTAGKYTDYITGDRDAALGVIRDLEDSRDKLRARKDEQWQSYVPGLVSTFDKPLEQIKTNIGDAASTGLKERFGGRISNLELQNALKFSYNPALAPAQNADLLDKHIAQAKAKIAAKDKWAQYYENNGSLKGYSGFDAESPAVSGEGPKDSGTIDRAALYNKAAATGGKVVNGAVMPKKMIEGIQSMPTKGTASAPQAGATKVINDPDHPGKKINVKFNGKNWEEM